ncbi:MAG: right-handed parallel beta-helix repeat-containing protein [Oculatellaceae cyanobacterium bins.114]|nr:right-handed parallel beta-helix repeat-containing protein [Oculatellaceae cyanobacterium bins.114]
MAFTYYVSGSGSDNGDGLTPQTAFRNIQKAADLTQPGDTVYVMDGTYTNQYPNDDVLRITRSGTENAWITYKAYPGSQPKIVSANWNAIAVRGASYIIIDGFELQGNSDSVTLAQATAEKNNLNNPLTSGNGIKVGPSLSDSPTYSHHVIVRNNKVSKFPGGGITVLQSDYVTIENNIVHDNAFYSPYGNSGISLFQSWNFDSFTGHKMIIRNNIVYNNANYIPYYRANRLSDGNGIIVDDTQHTQTDSPFDPYQGRTLVENNLVYYNGGRGISTYKADHVDIFYNTVYYNMRSLPRPDADVNVNLSNDIRILNNIIVTNRRPATTSSNSTNVIGDYNVIFNATTHAIRGNNDLINVNPQFTDPLAGNFTLLSTSPALNQGIRGTIGRILSGSIDSDASIPNSGSPNSGVPIPNGSIPDVGIPNLGIPNVGAPNVDIPNSSIPNTDASGKIQIIRGTRNRDRLTGTLLADWIDGSRSNDQIVGDQGNDRLLGGQGNDFLVGQNGDDILIGGLGNDRLIGGAGKDIFGLKRGEGLDVITDFKIGQDHLGLPSSRSFRGLKFVQSGRNTLVQSGDESLALLIGVRANQLLRSSFAFSNTFYQPIP